MMVRLREEQGQSSIQEEPEEAVGVKRWEERIATFEKWVKSHKTDEVKAGDELDVRDTEYIWCKA